MRWLDKELPLEERVSAVVAELSAADLQAIALGDFDPLTSRGIPAPNYVDAGTGLRGVEGATAFPAGIALAASFDQSLAEEYGAAVGEEARRAGFSVLLGPTVDLARDPVGGRIAEALGEDPHLAGTLGAAHVRGVQSRHVIAQVKHFVGYNGEKRRTGHGLEPDRGDSMDVQVGEQHLHDIYLRPFEATVRAGAWSMMGSYNRLGGAYVCESPDILGIPRRHWSWQGFYCPDFIFAVRDPAKALHAGLDLGALGGDGGRTPEMVAAADPQLLARAAANIVRAMIGVGLVDHPLPTPAEPSSEAHRELALRTAVAGAVLLRNDGLLPLSGHESIALIGPSGDNAIHVVGGAASVSLTPSRVTSPREAIAARAREVSLAEGSLGDVPLPPIPASAFSLPDGSGPGVEVTFTDGARTWIEVHARIDHELDPLTPGKAWPLTCRTTLTPTVSGDHRISLTMGGFARLRIDGHLLLAGARETERFISGPHYPLQALVPLRAGEPVALEIDFEPGPAISIPPMGLGPTLRLGWQEPDDRLDAAARIAADSDVAIVFATMATGEGMDRDGLKLPGDQDDMIRRVCAANPRTLVVLNTPGAVEMPWAGDAAGILQVWYPGERYGEALALMLFGDEEPGGRLPLTFPHRREHLPGALEPGEVPESLDYDVDEGIGYRAVDVIRNGALFPFGFGLGYADTTCTVSNNRRLPDGSVELELTATNHSERATVHVAQVYARRQGESARELIGIQRIALGPRAQERRLLVVAPGDLARWDTTVQARMPVAGHHTLYVATHSGEEGHPVEMVV